MPTDQHHALRQLIRSYALQIDYIMLLVRRGLLEPDGAQVEIDALREKMDFAAERFCQLWLTQQDNQQPHGRAIDPALIPDLQYIFPK